MAGAATQAYAASGPRDAVTLDAPAVTSGPAALDRLRIGSKRFTESYILAEILAQQVQAATHVKPQLRQGLGNTAVVYQALRAGEIDLYADYTGTVAAEILKLPASSSLSHIAQALAPLGLGVGVPLGFNNGYALAMTGDRAGGLKIERVSDLTRHPELRLGLSNEFIGREDGWKGLKPAYALPHTPTGLDHGLAFDALERGRIDVTDVYTTDARIVASGLRVLADDRKFFPRYDAVLLYRLDVPQRFPTEWSALQQLQGRIGEARMRDMNAQAELQREPFETIARAFLASDRGESAATETQARATQTAPGQPGWWQALTGPDLWRLTRQHITLVALSVAAAIVLAVPAGIMVSGLPRLRAAVLAVTGLLQTVPTLAMLAVLIAVTGSIGVLPAMLALGLYALLPILRGTCTGLAGVPAGLRTAAFGLGMTRAQSVRHIELPLALPSIVAGVRTATTIAIGTATLAAFVGAGGYGERIVTGLALIDHRLLLAGAIPAAVLALAAEALFEGLELWRRRIMGVA